MYFWLVIAILLLIIIYLFYQNTSALIRTYKLSIPFLHPDLKQKKIAFISDTHLRNRELPRFIERIISEIKEQEPDLILFGGDIIHVVNSDSVIENAENFFAQLNKIAPTYVVYGNHDLKSKQIGELTRALNQSGARLLQNEAEWVSFAGTTEGFWLLGLSEHESTLEIKEDALSKIELPNGSKNQPKILLAHFPHLFEKYLTDENKRPNLVLSGHTHGGQVILPIVGGLLAPNQGTNPYYDYGLFTDKKYPDSRLIITRGIGNSTFPFRINNRPEIVILEFE